MLDRFTDRARRVMSLAKQEAVGLKTSNVGTEHLLLALAKEDEGIAAEALRSLEITYDDILEQLQASATTKPASDAVPESAADAAQAAPPAADAAAPADTADADAPTTDARTAEAPGEQPAGKLAFTPAVIAVMEKSFRLARENNQTYVSTEHLLLGMVDESSCRGMDILMRLGVSAAAK